MNIYIARHGQTKCNEKNIIQGWLDSELNESGIFQAQQIGKELQQVPFDYIFCSDLRRALDTAKIILQTNDFSVDLNLMEEKDPSRLFVDWRLRERCLGNLEGTSSKEIDTNIYFSDNENLNFESMEMFNSRVSSFLDTLKKLDGRNILVVAHNGTINVINEILNGTDNKAFHNNAEIIKITI